MILSIQYLRGIAALFVVFYHLKFAISNLYTQKDLGEVLFNSGYFGVDLFFMISGFVIVLSTKNDSSKISFLIKRIFRIYPLYLVMIAFSCIAIANNYTNLDILKSIFFIHLNYFDMPPFYGYSIISAAWTLSYEVAFYMIFLLSMSLNHKYRTLICSAAIIALYLFLNIYFKNPYMSTAYSSINYTGFASGLLKIVSSQMMIEFIFGMITCEVVLKIKNNHNLFIRKSLNPIYISTAIMSVAMIISPQEYGHGISRVGTGCYLLFTSLIILEKINGFRKIKPLIFLGDISYSLYLSHLVVLKVIADNPVKMSYLYNMYGFSKIIMMIALFILIAYILHKTIEVPFVNLARKILR